MNDARGFCFRWGKNRPVAPGSHEALKCCVSPKITPWGYGRPWHWTQFSQGSYPRRITWWCFSHREVPGFFFFPIRLGNTWSCWTVNVGLNNPVLKEDVSISDIWSHVLRAGSSWIQLETWFLPLFGRKPKVPTLGRYLVPPKAYFEIPWFCLAFFFLFVVHVGLRLTALNKWPAALGWPRGTKIVSIGFLHSNPVSVVLWMGLQLLECSTMQFCLPCWIQVLSNDNIYFSTSKSFH